MGQQPVREWKRPPDNILHVLLLLYTLRDMGSDCFVTSLLCYHILSDRNLRENPPLPCIRTCLCFSLRQKKQPLLSTRNPLARKNPDIYNHIGSLSTSAWGRSSGSCQVCPCRKRTSDSCSQASASSNSNSSLSSRRRCCVFPHLVPLCHVSCIIHIARSQRPESVAWAPLLCCTHSPARAAHVRSPTCTAHIHSTSLSISMQGTCSRIRHPLVPN
jgi:hypothetical protein